MREEFTFSLLLSGASCSHGCVGAFRTGKFFLISATMRYTNLLPSAVLLLLLLATTTTSAPPRDQIARIVLENERPVLIFDAFVRSQLGREAMVSNFTLDTAQMISDSYIRTHEREIVKSLNRLGEMLVNLKYTGEMPTAANSTRV